MNAYKKMLMVLRERFRTNHFLCLTIITFALITGTLALLAAPAECSEIYTSANSNFPYHFENESNSCLYQTSSMDAVNFAGREMIFFTHESNCLVDSYLFYYNLVDKDPHWFQVFDYVWNVDVWFKTVVFNNVLYIFYTKGDNTIYYRTATVDYGADGNAWNLIFSDQKSLSAGISYAKIRSAVVMNGQLYIIYSDSSDTPHFYYISSADGLEFGLGTLFFTSPANSPSWSSDAAVFMVPDGSGGAEEKLMIVYAPGGPTIYYFFFDGEWEISYGHWYVNTGLADVRSVRLFVGTAEGYTNNKYAIQVFCATPTSNSAWDYIYHGEYTPSGTDGEQGDWSSTWTQLSQSDDDHVYDLHEPNWAIIPYFEYEDANQRMKLRIWYSKNTLYHYEPFGYGYETFGFRSSTYKSDLLEHTDDTGTQTDPDMSACPIVGVILGTPPYPENNGVPTDSLAGISTVELESNQTVSFATTWTATAGTAVSYGRKFGPLSTQAKLSAGVKHSEELTSGTAVYKTDTLKSYNYPGYPGGLAWVLYLKPAFLTDQYILKDYDGNQLSYDGDTSELRVSLMTYDESNTSLQIKAFYIDDPGGCMGGTDCSTEIFAGMAKMPKRSDFCDWNVAVTSTDSYKIPDYGYLPSLQSSQGDKSYTKYTETATNAVTNGWSAGFSTSASVFGFTAEGNVNYSMDFKTTTSMTKSLGFSYAVPSCGGPDSTTTCISDATVYPYVLVPNEDATGYNAPWISDDIRNFQKPKPWAITYSVASSNKDACTATSSLAATRIEVQKIHGTLFLDETDSNRDKLSAKISLIVPPGFLMNRDEWVHLRFGNYFTDSDRLEVISRRFEGKNLVLEMKGPNPDSSITVRLSYKRNKSILDIHLDANRVDLTPLYAYKFLGVGKSTDGKTDFGLYLGGKYFAKSELGVQCTVNDKNGICKFNSK